MARGGVPNDRVSVEYVSAVGDGSARVVVMEVISAPTCGA